ncbi:MAG: riboflavin biosynthesis protein RibF [Spirochaetae bacterium HGW-Spirochaetae-9]|nr:MAG: riboflavin biosynthesis protein RibF [Spirochaetae bacterium HGW-Spirochaetae-9]
MNILAWSDFIASREYEPLAVMIGVFDGVHRGHQSLMDAVLAKRPAMKTAVVTFMENPKKILHPQTFRGSLFNLDQKIDSFAEAGFDACVLIDFSQNFGTLSGADFLSLLADAGVRYVCIGPNFRCGYKMDTNAQALAAVCGKLGIEARIVEPVMYGGHPVSSSRIRNAVLEGRLAEAAVMLGRPHTVEVDGTDTALPPDGCYAVIVDPEEGGSNLRTSARIEAGKIFVEALENRAARRVAIVDTLSQECKEK